MRTIGTIIIICILVISYFAFDKRQEKEVKQEKEKQKNFFEELEKSIEQRTDYTVVYAGGDDNNEVPVSVAIKHVNMPQNIRIKKYGQK